ncbi:MAG: selenocysteine-specific translation elongation factor [Actinobacteria bacterium]|nr:selenocysteine-specific translation elongation factor [Actinomycetota bacterium]MCG2818996.1 selenocysteine-specific translation elongation factor [Actinomycetes bacterium]MBU4178803.1 selenocysteine-specific translation elongation factor [Actinomycetota bacterium]MBU4217836.1 selenocysteine-specific translation elongation factor [Actinomycetota bacterium]MBU4359326.1 selenocysteine-specific translation elongation factor [Actinomycetota bacterium]
MEPHRNVIIGTAGHIDHGKTVLVKALTGRNTDRLAEEQQRGISIDLGFAPFLLSDGSTAGIVDVPGHENFIRNMMSGATGIDLALLVVAADDGVMPQTREHLAILDLLGVSSAVVAVTKTDLAGEEFVELVTDEVKDLLEGTGLAGSPVIPVSAVSGEGIDALKEELELQAGLVRLKDEQLPARLPIDRVFTLKGIGTVVTGTLWSGTVGDTDHLELLPGGMGVRLRSLQVHDRSRDTVFAGERVAANLAGVSHDDVTRGDVLVTPGTVRPTYMVDASVTVLSDCKRPLKRGTRVRFHHGTREVMGRIYPLEGDRVAPGETRPAQLRLESLVVCAPEDRFIIRSYSPVTTIGGGTVVDAHPVKHKAAGGRTVSDFHELEVGGTRSLAVFLTRARKPVTSENLILESGLSPAVVNEGIKQLVKDGEAVTFSGKGVTAYLASERYEELADGLVGIVTEFHRTKPLAEGIAKETLKKKALEGWDSRTGEILMENLSREGRLEVDGNLVRLHGAFASVSEEQKRMLAGITGRIEGNPVSPPSLGELSEELGKSRQTLSELLEVAQRDGTLVRVSPELYFSRPALEDIEGMLTSAALSDGITVSDFRKLIGTSRKYALPLLEYFDRVKVTVRVGDKRRLRTSFHEHG